MPSNDRFESGPRPWGKANISMTKLRSYVNVYPLGSDFPYAEDYGFAGQGKRSLGNVVLRIDS